MCHQPLRRQVNRAITGAEFFFSEAIKQKSLLILAGKTNQDICIWNISPKHFGIFTQWCGRMIIVVNAKTCEQLIWQGKREILSSQIVSTIFFRWLSPNVIFTNVEPFLKKYSRLLNKWKFWLEYGFFKKLCISLKRNLWSVSHFFHQN